MDSNKITVEVAYAEPQRQEIISLEVDPGTTAIEAVIQSGMQEKFPVLSDTQALELGIFSKQATHDQTLEAGERVEIYRPLLIDPKEARRLKAEVAARRKQEAGQAS